jgi:hypothetical protein
MNIGSALFDRTLDHPVDQPDDRRLAGKVAQPFDIGLRIHAAIRARDIGRPLPAPVKQAVQRRLDIGRGRDTDFDRRACRHADRVDREPVQRIGHGEHHAVRPLFDRHDARLLQKTETQPILE